MTPIQQGRNAGALVLTGVSITAHQPLVTVLTSIQDTVAAVFEAVASVASNMALTPAPILTGIRVTEVYHLLAEGPCKHRR